MLKPLRPIFVVSHQFPWEPTQTRRNKRKGKRRSSNARSWKRGQWVATIVMERFSPFQSLEQAEVEKKHLKHSFLLYSHLPVASLGETQPREVLIEMYSIGSILGVQNRVSKVENRCGWGETNIIISL